MAELKNTLTDHLILLVAFLACLTVFTILKIHGDGVGIIDDIMLILVGALAGVSIPKGITSRGTADSNKV